MNQTDIDISIIIVNYNSGDFILQCLQSIYNSKFDGLAEIIVVDNCSTDDSVKNLINQFPDVKFIELEENLGFAKANNIGAKDSHGRYLLVLNPDTIIQENTLSVMTSFMDSHLEIGISGCKVLNSDGTFQEACRRGFPTPWASFCKLFGLQKMFPNSKIFGQYNQTFQPIDATYKVDAVIGAFMFIRREAWNSVKGFDESFFMYGEDIDLCFQIQKAGYKIYYLHTTSILHYKGVSTRRSSMDELKHFYSAMEIFANKNISGSRFFLFFLKIGINCREVLARIFKYKLQFLLIFLDLFSINISLILGTKIRFEGFFNFPEYAYPTVFIVVSIILLVSMVGVGEYFENKPSIRKSLFGLLVTFFILSSLTYFFKDYAFSRGVVLMTIGFSILFMSLTRILISFYDKTKGVEGDRRVAIIGTDNRALNIYENLLKTENRSTVVVGFINTPHTNDIKVNKDEIIGSTEYLWKIINDNKIKELIITDSSMTSEQILNLIEHSSKTGIRYHFAKEWDEIITARIINEVTGNEPTVSVYNITKLRYKILKVSSDIIISIIVLTIGLPFVFLFTKEPVSILNDFFKVILRKLSVVGLYSSDQVRAKKIVIKNGLTGLAHISRPDRLTTQAIKDLNDYYLKNYSLALDFEIILKSFIRNKSGN